MISDVQYRYINPCGKICKSSLVNKLKGELPGTNTKKHVAPFIKQRHSYRTSFFPSYSYVRYEGNISDVRPLFVEFVFLIYVCVTRFAITLHIHTHMPYSGKTQLSLPINGPINKPTNH